MLHKQFWKIVTCVHVTCHLKALFGGGSKSAPDPVKAAAPVSETARDIFSAGKKRRQDLARRQGIAATIFSGNRNTLAGGGKTQLSGEQ